MAKKTLGFAAGAVSRAAAPIARAAAFLARTAAPLARAAAFLRTIAMGVGSATGWGIVVAAMTTLVGLFGRAAKMTGENNAFNVMLKGQREREAKLREEIDAVETLTDRNEALKHVEEELAAAREARKDTTLDEHRLNILDAQIAICGVLKAKLEGLNEEALRAAEIERQRRADLARRHDYAVQNQADMEKSERAEKELAGKRQFEQAMASAKTPTERRTIADERVKTLQYEASLIEMLIASVKQSGLGISPDAFKADLARLHDLKEEIASIGVDRAREDQQESARREKQASWMTKFRENLALLKGVGSPAEIERRQKIDETAREIMEQGGEKDKTKAEALATKRVDAEAELQRKKQQDERPLEIQSDRLSRIGLYVGGGGRADGHQREISAHTRRMVELQQRTHEVLKRLLEKACPEPTAVWG